jgi:intraflagellar transport protein 74
MNTANKPIGTSMGRLPTGARQINQDALKTIGFTTNVKVEERAVTRQGLEGMKSKKEKKIERKILDKYYYTELYKKKINDVTKEVTTMKNEIDTISQDISAYNNLNKTFETLSKEVQNLEGELADYNLAGDKYRSMMRAEDIEAVFNHIKLNNKKKRDDSDYLYLEKAKREEELHKVEYETTKIMQAIETKLLELEPEQKIEYEQLREENQQYIIKIHELRDELNRLNAEVIEGENLLRNNPNKREAHKTKDSINQMTRKKEELELQTNEVIKKYFIILYSLDCLLKN